MRKLINLRATCDNDVLNSSVVRSDSPQPQSIDTSVEESKEYNKPSPVSNKFWSNLNVLCQLYEAFGDEKSVKANIDEIRR